MSLPVVLIPGLMCDARVYGPQIEALSGRMTMHVACPPSGASISEMAHAILVAAPLRFALAGLSMGGIIALEMIAQAPERVERLALMATTARADPEAAGPVRAARIARVAAGDLPAVMREEVRPHHLADGPNRAAVLDLCARMAASLGAAVYLAQERALAGRADLTGVLGCISVPSLVLCGAADRLCPVDGHREMHRAMSGSRLEVVAGAGHLPTLEAPEATTAALRRWLEE